MVDCIDHGNGARPSASTADWTSSRLVGVRLRRIGVSVRRTCFVRVGIGMDFDTVVAYDAKRVGAFPSCMSQCRTCIGETCV